MTPNKPAPFVAKSIAQTRQDTSIADLLDRLLDTGAVVDAHLILGVADVELVYVNLKALICAYDRVQDVVIPGYKGPAQEDHPKLDKPGK